MEDRIENLLTLMTLEEKISMLAGADLWHTVPVKRLGIPVMKVTDGPNGARGSEGSMAPSSVCIPVGIALAATWNPELVERIGNLLADEVKAKGAHMLLAPTVNIHRSPLAGRNFECYSEDPYLTSRMAVAYIRGLQSQGVSACIKHFVCNDSEYQRHSMSSEISERALREIYLYPFMVAVRDAKTWSIMSAYNKVNGVWCSENKYLLLDILKGEWGFDGMVMSDWTGTYTNNVAAGGLDLEMPGPARWMGENVLQAIRSGSLSETFIDDKVRRILRTLERVGAFKHPDLQPEQSIDRPDHRSLVREAASEAIVLLKNENNLLPLDPAKIKSIAVIGANAHHASILGGGSASVTPHYVISPLDAIRRRAGDQTNVQYAIGRPIHRSTPKLEMSWFRAANGQPGLITVDLYPTPDFSASPARTIYSDRSEISWTDRFIAPEPDSTLNPNEFSARLSATLTPPESGRYTFSLWGNGRYKLLIDGQTIIDHWAARPTAASPWDEDEYKGEVELIAGRSCPFTIEFTYQGTNPWRVFRIGCLPPLPTDILEQAVKLAAQCDLAIVFAGFTDEWESEGYDRPDMNLPCDQNELVEKVAAANPNTIVVLNTGSPINMPWLDKAAAVLEAWYTGQESGNAVADILFGDVNPSGKLPTTFAKRLEDSPAYINYPGENGRVYYGEGLFVGYRYYDKKDVEPLFPFGFGMSYTTFTYRNLYLSQSSYGPQDKIQISLEVQNTGARPGKEIVQLYLRDVLSSLVRPPKELKAFTKVDLQPSEIKTVTFELDRQALAFYDDSLKSWKTEPGAFEVLIGSSSRHIHLSAQFEWQGDPPEASSHIEFHIGLPIQQLLDSPAAKAVLEKHLPELLKAPQLSMALAMNLEQIAPFAPGILNPEKLEQINADLKKIK